MPFYLYVEVCDNDDLKDPRCKSRRLPNAFPTITNAVRYAVDYMIEDDGEVDPIMMGISYEDAKHKEWFVAYIDDYNYIDYAEQNRDRRLSQVELKFEYLSGKNKGHGYILNYKGKIKRRF